MIKIRLLTYTFFIKLVGTAYMIFLISCSNERQKNKPLATITKKKDTVFKKPPGSYSDTIIINFPSAVFYNPDSLQLERIKEITNKNLYETDVHNCFYLMRNARNVMKKYWPNLRIVETSTNRYILFVKNDKSKICIDLNDKSDMCGIFLFDKKKDPELADMMNIDTALGFYFKK